MMACVTIFRVSTDLHVPTTGSIGMTAASAHLPRPQATPSDARLVRVGSITLDVADDHVLKHAKLSQPIQAVAELIWNALDADATVVSVDVEVTDLGAPDRIAVTDNGSGMPNDLVLDQFKSVGGSWKLGQERTELRKVPMHGEEGKGRLRAFALGESGQWTTTGTNAAGTPETTTIRFSHSSPVTFEVSDPLAAPDVAPGTTFETRQPRERASALVGPDAYGALVETFALRLLLDPDVKVSYRGKDLDPDLLLVDGGDTEIEVPVPEELESAGRPVLRVLQWTEKLGSAQLSLCGSDGISLAELPPGTRVPTGVHVSAYLLWDGFTVNRDELDLAPPENHPLFSEVIEAARVRLKERIAELYDDVRGRFVEDLEAEGTYPWGEAASSDAERLTRQTFDIVAVETQHVLPSDLASKKLLLGLLRQAIEKSPDDLPKILTKLVDLPADKLKSLSDLLERTTVSAIIEAASTVADRTAFLAALREIVADPAIARQTTEIRHLHRIIENEAWLFGEQYNLTASEIGLTSALRRHVELLGRSELTPEPVTDADGIQRRLDLLLSRTRSNGELVEHLVVELKRPDLKVGHDELTQIERYADALSNDPAYSSKVKWEFWLITTEIRSEVRAKLSAHDRPGLLLPTPTYNIWVKEWSELIEEAEHRMRFLREKLELRTTEEDALTYVRTRHAERIPPILTGQPA